MEITYTINSSDDGESCVLAHHQAEDMLLLLQRFDEDMRQEAKYGEGAPAACAEKLREAFHRRMDEFCVVLGQ